MAAVAKAYGVAFSRAKPDAAGDYAVDHSSQTVLFDGTGAPIALLPTDQDGSAVAAELAKWVR